MRAAEKITKEQIKRLYALGSSLGMVKRGPDDALHVLVESMTGKESISTLTQLEFESVQTALMGRMRFENRPASVAAAVEKKKAGVPAGMMPREQQALSWRFIYRLQEIDKLQNKTSSATAGERMCGAIKKILGLDADVKNPFTWVTVDQGQILIEQLKRYVRSAERKAAGNSGKGQQPASRANSG